MEGFLVVLLFGFPAVFVSLLVSVSGVIKEKYWLVIIGAVLFLRFLITSTAWHTTAAGPIFCRYYKSVPPQLCMKRIDSGHGFYYCPNSS